MPSTRTLEVEVENTRAALMVRVKGEAGSRCADDLQRELMPVIALRPAVLVVDLADLSYISSLGLGALIELQHNVGDHGGSVRFASAQPYIHDVVKRCKLDSMLSFYPSVESALAAS